MQAAERLEEKHEVLGRCAFMHDSYFLVLHLVYMKQYPTPRIQFSTSLNSNTILPCSLTYSVIIKIIQNPDVIDVTKLTRKLRISALALLTPMAVVVSSLPVSRQLVHNYLLYFLQSLLILFRFNAIIILATSQIPNRFNTMHFLFHITNQLIDRGNNNWKN